MKLRYILIGHLIALLLGVVLAFVSLRLYFGF